MKEYIEHTCGECIHSEICEHLPTLTGWDVLNPAHCKGFRNAAYVVERKRGRWIDIDGEVFECDMCHGIRTGYKYNFCPDCGADMRGEKHEAD